MKHKSPSSVFQLIKTLDRGEKRFFSLYCSRQDNKVEKNYIKLFKYIDKQTSYDEFLLKKEFKIYGTQFNLAKSYLYKLVLESLAQYYSQNQVSTYDQLLKIKVLYERGLYKQAQKMILKVRKLAEEQNDFIIAMETVAIEREVLLKSGSLTRKDIERIQQQNKNYSTLNAELDIYRQIHEKVVYFEFKYVKMYPDDLERECEFKEIAASALFINTAKPHSTISKWILLYTRGLYYKISGDYKKAGPEYLAAIKVLDGHPLFKQNHPNYVANTLKGYIASYIVLKKFDLALKRISELKTFCSLYPTMETKMSLLTSHSMEQIIYVYTNRKNDAMQLLSEVENKIGMGEKVLDSNRIAFYSNAVTTCTLFSEYQKSMHWTNKVLNFEFAEKRFPNMYCSTRVMELINLAELGDYDLLFYKMKSLHRFLGKQNSIYRYQEIYMGFVRRILKGEFNKNNLLELYKEVREALVKALKDPKESQACHFFDFVGWFDSKIKNIPYNPSKWN